MRQLFVERGALTIRDVCKPLLDDYSVLVSVSYSFMGMDGALAQTIQANHYRFLSNIPTQIRKIADLISRHDGVQTKTIIKERLSARVLPIGNSCSGVVLATGKKVRYVSVGDMVACVGSGVAHHAEIVCIPEHLVVPIDDESLLKVASLTGYGTMALQSLRRANVVLGEVVCIIGADLLGQLMVQLFHVAGCRVFVLDSSPQRLECAKKVGAEGVFELATQTAQESLEALTRSYGVDCTVICPEYIQDSTVDLAFDITRKKGRVVLVGNTAVTIKHERVQRKELDVLFSLSYGPGRYDVAYEYQGNDYPYPYVRWTENRNMQAFVRLLKDRKLTIDYLCAHEVPFEKAHEYIQEQSAKSTFGVVLAYQTEKTKSSNACDVLKSTDNASSFMAARKDASERLKVTFYGAGRSTRLWVMPIVSAIKGVAIHRIIDSDIARALSAAKQYKGAVALAGDPELFYDDVETDVAYIACEQGVHVEHVINALQKGKVVYLHRPLGLNNDELARLNGYLEQNEQARVCFGYYRSSSSFVKKIKKQLEGRQSPLMITSRLNLSAAGSRDTLDQRPRTGNVVDKASHMFDMFVELIQAKPVAVSVEVLRPMSDSVFLTDNFAVQISFSDGSIAALQVSSIGSINAGVERMEVHYDGKTIVMDDFVRLNGFGLPASFDEVVRVPNKGREQYLQQFFAAVRSNEMSPCFDRVRVATVAQLTLQIDRLVCQGGGEMNLAQSV